MKHIELSPILEKVVGSIGVQLGPHQQSAQEDLNNRHLFDNQPDDMIGVDRACVVKHHPTPLLHQCSHLGFLIISRFVLNRATFSFPHISHKEDHRLTIRSNKEILLHATQKLLFKHRIPMKQSSLSYSKMRDAQKSK